MAVANLGICVPEKQGLLGARILGLVSLPLRAFVALAESPFLHQDGKERVSWSLEVHLAMNFVSYFLPIQTVSSLRTEP